MPAASLNKQLINLLIKSKAVLCWLWADTDKMQRVTTDRNTEMMTTHHYK
jgi:hypothetical protein